MIFSNFSVYKASNRVSAPDPRIVPRLLSRSIDSKVSRSASSPGFDTLKHTGVLGVMFSADYCGLAGVLTGLDRLFSPSKPVNTGGTLLASRVASLGSTLCCC